MKLLRMLLLMMAVLLSGCTSKIVFKRHISKAGLEHLGRVIGGSNASPTTYPFAAFLMIDEGDATAFCGGTIIGRQWILTAGHCVVDTSKGHAMLTGTKSTHPNGTEPHMHAKHTMQIRSLRAFKTVAARDIVVGVGDVRNTHVRPLKVSKVYIHPDLNLDYFDNDIALIKLKKKLTFNSHVQPIRINTDVISDQMVVTGVGWGKTSLSSQNTASVLQQVDLTIGDEGLCQRIRPEFTGNDGNYICVTTPEGRDTCSGDSGGPLLRRCSGDLAQGGSSGTGPWVQLGITSYGDSVASSQDTVCAATDGAGFYTHAAQYLDFISKTTGIKRESLSATCNGSRLDFVGDANTAPMLSTSIVSLALFMLLALSI
ncbi:hypothetical protein IW147_001627 [Coemansia sp. RSA 720]|nr:hypothetical protein IW147_001627 [Coemansia sp. RSA 720]